MASGYFITGTDTGIGKTLIACALLHGFVQQGLSAVGMKPVAAGCESVPQGIRCEDVVRLREAGNIDAPANLINPYALLPPVAPHVAAEQAGIEIDLARICDAFEHLQRLAGVVVVEGVGGFRVPLNARQDTADLAAMLGLPIILVCGMRLGCLNHALLSAEAISRRGLSLAGWVANRIEPDMPAFEENVQALEQRLAVPLLGVVPYSVVPQAENVAKYLRLDNLRAI